MNTRPPGDAETGAAPDAADGELARLRAENAQLRETVQLFKYISNTVVDGLLVLDAEDQVRFCNRQLAEEFGLSSGEVEGRSLLEALHPNDRGDASARLERRRAGIAERFERRYTRRDGSNVWLMVSSAPIVDDGVYKGAVVSATDISDLKAVEAALSFSSDRLAAIFEAQLDCVMLLSSDTHVLQVNGAGIRLLEAEFGERLLGRRFEQLVPEAQREAFLEAFRSALAGRTARLEHELSTLTGERRWVETNAVRLADGSGRELVLSVTRDIGERRRAEAHLRRLTRILESTSDLVGTADAEGRLVYLNRAGRLLLGLPEGAQPEGRCVAEFFAGNGFEVLTGEALTHAVAHGAWRGELSMVRSDGSEVDVSLVVVAAPSDSGELASFSCIARDISEEKRRAAVLAESNQRYEALSNATREVVWDWDVVGDRMVWSRNVATLGYAEGDAMPTLGGWMELVHAEDRERVDRKFQAALEGGESSWSDEYRFQRQDGTWIWIADQCAILRNPEGRPVRVIGSMSDVTARKELQTRLLLTERLASVGTMAAGVAHEINNPLAYVLANIGFVSAELKALEREHGQGERPRAFFGDALQALGEAREGAERVRGIVRDLKVFSRSDDDEREQVDLRPVLESAVNIAQNEIRHRALLIRDLREVPRVEGNAGRLGQVFLNLLTNAAQAIPDGDCSEHEVRVRAFTDAAGRAVVEVTDTGCGISKELRGRLFDPFFTTKPVGEGTGLGLAICHGIVQGMNGQIEVESEVGRGSTFRVVLPAAGGGPSAVDAPVPVRLSGVRRRVLVIDDEPLIGRAVRRCLRNHDVTVFTAADEALGRLREGERFDLVLCDLMMPGMSGMEFHEAVSKEFPALLPRIAFLTGGAFTPRAATFLQSVPNARVEKPFRAEALAELVERLGRAA